MEHVNNYQESFKVIELYDGMNIPTLLASLEDGKITMATDQALKKKWLKNGLPNIALKISAFLKAEKKK